MIAMLLVACMFISYRKHKTVMPPALRERTYRFRNNNDVVTRVPPPGFIKLRYRHIGTPRYFDAQGRLRPKITKFRQLLDRLRGRLKDLGKLGTDGMKDHAMDRYLENLEKNANGQG